MAGYIRIDKDQVADQRLYDLAERVAPVWTFAKDLPELERRHALRHALLGVTVTLWAYADSHIRADNSVTVTLDGLSAILNVPVTVLAQFPPQWIKVRADGYVELPGYCEKNLVRARDLRHDDRAAKREHERELAAERQRRKRKKDRESVTGVTSRKSARDSNAVTPHTGTGTGTLDHTRYRTDGAATRAAGPAAAAAPRKSFADDFVQRFGEPPAKAKP